MVMAFVTESTARSCFALHHVALDRNRHTIIWVKGRAVLLNSFISFIFVQKRAPHKLSSTPRLSDN